MEKDRRGLDSNVLRFLGRMDTTKPIDMDRRFIISYFLSDDTILVFEPPVRNSGRCLHLETWIIMQDNLHTFWKNWNHVFLYARSETSDILWYGVCLSVRPSVSHIMSAQYLEKFLSDSHGTW